MSTESERPAGGGGGYVSRDVCERIHAEQQEADRRTYEEIRSLRRLVITLVVGGQLFTGGLNLAGVGYWLRQHEAAPHAATVEMIGVARAEEREDVRELRCEIRDLAGLLAKPHGSGLPQARPDEGGAR